MTSETVQMTDRVPIPWTTKINPLWWLVGPDGWTVPEINNGEPYLPDAPVLLVWLPQPADELRRLRRRRRGS
jgi:hypothetical protein